MWENAEDTNQRHPLLCNHSVKSSMIQNTTCQENPFLKTKTARFSCRQLGKAGNPAINQNRARVTTLFNSRSQTLMKYLCSRCLVLPQLEFDRKSHFGRFSPASPTCCRLRPPLPFGYKAVCRLVSCSRQPCLVSLLLTFRASSGEAG